MAQALAMSASLVHCLAAGVLAPKTAAQNLAQTLLLAKARPGNNAARAVPPRMPPMRRSAWRREVAVAMVLVRSSKQEGSISLPFFLDKLVHPGVDKITQRVRTIRINQ